MFDFFMSVQTNIKPFSKSTFLNVKISVINLEELLYAIDRFVDAPFTKPRLVNNVNIYAMNLAEKNVDFRNALNDSEIVFCDGVGVKIGAHFLGTRIGERITPPDWIDILLESLHQKKRTIFFLGDTKEVINSFSKKIAMKYPNLDHCGYHHGYFQHFSDESESIIEKINTYEPDILILAMGMPLQEIWSYKNRDRLKAKVILSTGSLFRYYSGAAKRAPRWLTDNGFEWLTRMVLNPPSNSFERYFIGNVHFLRRICGCKLKRFLSQSDEKSTISSIAE